MPRRLEREEERRGSALSTQWLSIVRVEGGMRGPRRKTVGEKADDNRYERGGGGGGMAYGKRYSRVTGFGIITNHFFHMKVNPSDAFPFIDRAVLQMAAYRSHHGNTRRLLSRRFSTPSPTC